MEEGLLRRRTADVLLRAGAAFGFVFGSRAAGGAAARENSDLDVAAWWPHDPPARWDVPVPDRVDLVVLNDAPLEMAGAIALTGELLFEVDAAVRVQWVATTRKIWLDEKPRFERSHAEFLEAVRGR